jgi:hypothetical protein
MGFPENRRTVTAITWPSGERRQMTCQSDAERRNQKEAQLMLYNKITTYAVDTVALASAIIIATPFVLVISAPFLGAM